MDERRKFERVRIPESAAVRVDNQTGQALGPVRMLGRGGLLAGIPPMPPGEHLTLVIVDEREGIRRPVHVISRYNSSEGVAFEFDDLDAESAVEIGVIIGKHYVAGTGT